MTDQGFNATAVDQGLRADAAEIIVAGYNLRGTGNVLPRESAMILIATLLCSGLDGSRTKHQ